jgi:T-complex protein 1 subunit alpha
LLQPLKTTTTGAKESMFIAGYALNCTIASPAMPHSIKKAKIACLDFNLNKQKMGLGVSIVVKDAQKVEEIKQRYDGGNKKRRGKEKKPSFLSFIVQ